MSRKSARASFLTRSALNSVFHITTGAGGPFSKMESFGEGGVDMAMNQIFQARRMRMASTLLARNCQNEECDRFFTEGIDVTQRVFSPAEAI